MSKQDPVIVSLDPVVADSYSISWTAVSPTTEESAAMRDAAIARGAKRMPKAMADLSSKVCGCGDNTPAFRFVREYLRFTQKRNDANFTGPYRPADDASDAEVFGIYMIDSLELIEHGGGIGGSWLTEEGKIVLAFLEEHGDDWQDKGEFIDDDGVSHGDMSL